MRERQQPRKLRRVWRASWHTEDQALSSKGCLSFGSIRFTGTGSSGIEDQDQREQPELPAISSVTDKNSNIYNEALNLTAIPLALHRGRLASALAIWEVHDRRCYKK
jgi:hypothetical protein